MSTHTEITCVLNNKFPNVEGYKHTSFISNVEIVSRVYKEDEKYKMSCVQT